MSTSAASAREARVFYEDIKPYDVPASLDELHGPEHGLLDLPITVYWGPASIVDLDTPGGIAKAYQAVLREGRVSDQITLLNQRRLVQVWPELLLPTRVRELWETRFPPLSTAA
ncbi:hypothetical protein BWO91_16580 [Plantibacter flavus]|uniref:hypothetical protein n=1 Tax=Plantibacter flavus TaxID=150123 RepID=UPI00099CC645|nr:hypothetical protein [Plantibacter flavus]AQX81361.1 hypothetical protein BWO91_16580 [Plantibacter flavus]